MGYEKKYKDLVKAVKELQEANSSDKRIQNWVNENVPELAESEDERIVANIISWLKNIDGQTIPINDYNAAIAWLEKQGEQKSANKCEGCNNAKGCVACVDGSEWAHIEEQNPAWSEEDKGVLLESISVLQNSSHWVLADKLKSLKKRIGNFDNGYKVGFSAAKYNQWKPSDEQIEILNMILTNESMDDNIARILRELREQLKKLKG